MEEKGSSRFKHTAQRISACDGSLGSYRQFCHSAAENEIGSIDWLTGSSTNRQEGKSLSATNLSTLQYERHMRE